MKRISSETGFLTQSSAKIGVKKDQNHLTSTFFNSRPFQVAFPVRESNIEKSATVVKKNMVRGYRKAR
ncbi:hypothetical protein SDC9_123242 [bioreactor metagenome]|uniref:Uncharacterized protein n=1 Tax=bioreactor metagenome TaxID=1076179 RepID=A0A645CH38_9ZZZZ